MTESNQNDEKPVVGILLPDGSVNTTGELKCERCGKPLPWSRLDEGWAGMWAQEFGPVCDTCLAWLLENY